MATLDKVKMGLRITTTAYDEELADLIKAAEADMGIAGVVVPSTLDEIVTRAIITYCKMSFGLPEDYDRLKTGAVGSTPNFILNFLPEASFFANSSSDIISFVPLLINESASVNDINNYLFSSNLLSFPSLYTSIHLYIKNCQGQFLY